MEKFSVSTAFAIAKVLLYSQFITEDDFNETIQSLMDGTLTIRSQNGKEEKSQESQEIKKVKRLALVPQSH